MHCRSCDCHDKLRREERFDQANDEGMNELTNQQSVDGHEESHTKSALLFASLAKAGGRTNADEIA
jgi:hypothetical protein